MKPLNPPRTTTWTPRFSNSRHKSKPFKINWLQANQPIHPKSQPEPTNPSSPRPTLVEELRNSNHGFSKWKDIVKWHWSPSLIESSLLVAFWRAILPHGG